MERRDSSHPRGRSLGPRKLNTATDGSVLEVHGTPIAEGINWQKMMHQESLGRESRKKARTFGLREVRSRI